MSCPEKDDKVDDWSWLFAGLGAVAACIFTERELQSSALMRPGCILAGLSLGAWDFATGGLLAVATGVTVPIEWPVAILVGLALPTILHSNRLMALEVGALKFHWLKIAGRAHNHLADALDRALTSERSHWRKRTAAEAKDLGVTPKVVEEWLLDRVRRLRRLSVREKEERVGEIRAVAQTRGTDARREAFFGLIDDWHLNRSVGDCLGEGWPPPRPSRPTVGRRVYRLLSRMRW